MHGLHSQVEIGKMWKDSYILLAARHSRAFGDTDPRFFDHDSRSSTGCTAPVGSQCVAAMSSPNGSSAEAGLSREPRGELAPDPVTGILRFVD